MTSFSTMPAKTKAPSLGGLAAIFLGIAAIVYVLVSVGFAVDLIFHARTVPNAFQSLVLAALVAIIGSGMTTIGAVYGATLQSATAKELEVFKTKTTSDLANYSALQNRQLADLKSKADDALLRLKINLDAGTKAQIEIYGAATQYFHSLRVFALGNGKEEDIAAAEAAMICATRHLIFVNEQIRNEFFDFWQRGEQIRRNVREEADSSKRAERAAAGIAEKVQVAAGRKNLRELHRILENTATVAAVSQRTSLAVQNVDTEASV